MTDLSTSKMFRDGFEFAETRRSLPIALLRAREALMDRFRPMLNAHGVTEQQWRILRILQEGTEIDATALAERSCVLAPSLTRMLRTLLTRGFIVTTKDPKDGRRFFISISSEGRDFIARVAPESAAIYADIEAKLGHERIEALLDDLNTVFAALARPS
jgi:homoprotocatechuate degradation regulator HpaR